MSSGKVPDSGSRSGVAEITDAVGLVDGPQDPGGVNVLAVLRSAFRARRYDDRKDVTAGVANRTGLVAVCALIPGEDNCSALAIPGRRHDSRELPGEKMISICDGGARSVPAAIGAYAR